MELKEVEVETSSVFVRQIHQLTSLMYPRIPLEDRPVYPSAVLLLGNLSESLEEQLAHTLVAQCRDHEEVFEVK